jgi:hypothetical protein
VLSLDLDKTKGNQHGATSGKSKRRWPRPAPAAAPRSAAYWHDSRLRLGSLNHVSAPSTRNGYGVSENALNLLLLLAT